MKRILSFVVFLSLGLFSCNKHSEIDFDAQLKMDVAAIDDYLTANSIAASEDASGLRYTVSSVGAGKKPTLDTKINVLYTVRSLPTNDIYYETAKAETLLLGDAIPGWKIGIPLMTKGSVFTLYIPSGLAFGTSGAGSAIPANTNLSYEIQLLDDDALLAADIATIDSFLLDNLHTNPDSIHKDPSGLSYVFATKGNGPKPISTSSISVTYTGRLLPLQTVFTVQSTATVLQLQTLLTGWQIGIPQIPTGSQVTLYLPSALGYGPQGTDDGTVPPNAIMVFDINLIAAN